MTSMEAQVNQIFESNEPARVYSELLPLLSSMEQVDYDATKARIKETFAKQISLGSLDNAVKAYRKRLKLKQINADHANSKKTVIQIGQQLDDIKQASINALDGWNNPPKIFVKSSRLVTICGDEEGKPSIAEISQAGMQGFLSKAANFVNVRTTSDDVKVSPVFPPVDVVKGVLDGYDASQYPFPALRGITELPIVREDGTICQTPGYDAQSRYYYIPGDLIVPEISDNPIPQMTKEAVDLLKYWLGDFPFVDEASEAALLAMSITVVIRDAIKSQVPMCNMDAPKQGTGKTIASQAVGILATGEPATPQPPTQDEEEMRKRILTWLMPSPSVVLIDNITHVLESNSLNTALTSPTFGDRILATNTNITVRNRAVWFATGNNLRVGDDTARRCIKCRMDAKVERPQKRDAKNFRIKGGVNGFFNWTKENRGRLVWACLTLFRNWHAQGCPAPNVVPIGSFEEWTITLGGILESSGVQGFLANMDESDAVDDVSSQWASCFEAIHAKFPTTFTLRDLAKETLTCEDLLEALPSALTKNYAAYHRSNGLDPEFCKHIGNAFRTRKDQIHNGYQLQQAGKDRKHVVLWQITAIDKVEETVPAPVVSAPVAHATVVPLPVSEPVEDYNDYYDLQIAATRIKRAFIPNEPGYVEGEI